MSHPTAYPDLSPGLHRTGHACTCILRAGQLLMVPTSSGRWTFPGGGIERGESAEQAAHREAWEEAGAHVELLGKGFHITSPNGTRSTCFVARPTAFEPSPEGRPRLWIEPLDPEWQSDFQVSAALRVLRERGLL